MIGASLLWVGWFGFNAGSALEADDTAALAFVNTLVATAAAVLLVDFRRMGGEGQAVDAGRRVGCRSRARRDHTGLRLRRPDGALVIGPPRRRSLPVGRQWSEAAARADDTLDVFGVHGVGGTLGALLTGVFAAPSLGGQGIFDYVTNKISPDYHISEQLVIQGTGVLTTRSYGPASWPSSRTRSSTCSWASA